MIGRRCSVLLASVACLAALLGGPLATSASAAPAPLSDRCSTLFGCSTVVNDSSRYVMAAKDWCGPGDTGDTTDTHPSCEHPGHPQKYMSLKPKGGRTPPGQDWDVLMVSGGWCYKVKFHRAFPFSDFTRSYDNRGGPKPFWVKVGDEAAAHVLAQARDRCP